MAKPSAHSMMYSPGGAMQVDAIGGIKQDFHPGEWAELALGYGFMKFRNLTSASLRRFVRNGAEWCADHGALGLLATAVHSG